MNKKLTQLTKQYEELQKIYGDPSLKAITFGGCSDHPDICFVFMNPTARNITADPEWKGIRSPWIGTKNIWQLFHQIGIVDSSIYQEIRSIKGKDWTPEFAEEVYQELEKNKIYITNLGKCTQVDARPLPNSVYQKYLNLFFEEMEIVQPKIIILFGNQVSSIVLNQKISVSCVRKKEFVSGPFRYYSIYYPVGNGRFHMDKSIEDILYIMEQQKVGCKR